MEIPGVLMNKKMKNDLIKLCGLLKEMVNCELNAKKRIIQGL